MSSYQGKLLVCIDNGLFVCFARHLAAAGFDVIYHCPSWKRGRPIPNDARIGSGIDGITVEPNIHKRLKQADIVCFPDLLYADWQESLVEDGKPVWGARQGEDLEIFRVFAKQMMKAVGLPVNPYTVIKGLDNLREHLASVHDVHVKFSLFRGSWETWHHEDIRISEYRLDELQHRLGPLKNDYDFIIEEHIDTKIEVGYDGYSIDGEFPKIGGQGFEAKDAALIEIPQAYDDMPEEVRYINESLAPILKEYKYRCWFSSEIRIAKDGTPYLIDLTCREAAPAGESQLALWKNLGEIVWEGAHGNCVDPEPAAKFAVQAMIYSDRDEKQWQAVLIEEDIFKWVTLYNHMRKDGVDFAIPRDDALTDPYASNEIGTVVGVGDTVDEAIEHCKASCKKITGDSITIKTEAFEGLKEEMEHAEKKGLNLDPVSV